MHALHVVANGAGRRRVRRLAAGAGAGTILLLGLAGGGRMAADLDKQWMTVDFSPSTSVATALQVRAACSHIQDTPPLPLPKKQAVIDVMYGVRYDTTNSSPADLARLQTCLQNFKSVQGVDPEDVGDEGS